MNEEQVKDIDTWLPIEETAKTISTRLGVRVKPFRFADGEGGFIVGYLKEPDFATKLTLWSRINNGAGETTASALLETNLIHPESDERISNTNPDGFKYWAGACLAVLNTIELAIPEIKKK